MSYELWKGTRYTGYGTPREMRRTLRLISFASAFVNLLRSPVFLSKVISCWLLVVAALCGRHHPKDGK